MLAPRGGKTYDRLSASCGRSPPVALDGVCAGPRRSRSASVDATNWRAEHAIRPAVVRRKVCGGNRSRHGADTQQVLASVVRTAHQRALPRLICYRASIVASEFLLPKGGTMSTISPEARPTGSEPVVGNVRIMLQSYPSYGASSALDRGATSSQRADPTPGRR